MAVKNTEKNKKEAKRSRPVPATRPRKRAAAKRAPRKFSSAAAERELGKRAASVKKDDVRKVLEKESKILGILRRVPLLDSIVDDVEGLIKMLKDYRSGRYTEVPYYIIASMVAALLYLLSPIDAIPDFIPGIGFVDDVAVLGLCLKLASKEISRYKRWVARQS